MGAAGLAVCVAGFGLDVATDVAAARSVNPVSAVLLLPLAALVAMELRSLIGSQVLQVPARSDVASGRALEYSPARALDRLGVVVWGSVTVWGLGSVALMVARGERPGLGWVIAIGLYMVMARQALEAVATRVWLTADRLVVRDVPTSVVVGRADVRSCRVHDGTELRFIPTSELLVDRLDGSTVRVDAYSGRHDCLRLADLVTLWAVEPWPTLEEVDASGPAQRLRDPARNGFRQRRRTRAGR